MSLKAINTIYKGYRFRSRLEARWAVFFDALAVKWEYERDGYSLPHGAYLPDFWFPEWRAFAEVKGSDEMFDERCMNLAIDLVNQTGFPLVALIGSPELVGYLGFRISDPEGMSREVVSGHVHLERSASDGCLSFYYPADSTGKCTEKLEAAVHAARSARFEHGESGASPLATPPISAEREFTVEQINLRRALIQLDVRMSAGLDTTGELARQRAELDAEWWRICARPWRPANPRY